MKIGLQFAMPAELHALPGAKDLEPFETVSGVPFLRSRRISSPAPAASARSTPPWRRRSCA